MRDTQHRGQQEEQTQKHTDNHKQVQEQNQTRAERTRDIRERGAEARDSILIKQQYQHRSLMI